MTDYQLINKKVLAQLMDTSVQVITNKMHQGKEGIDLPYAIKSGANYKWKLGTVKKFIDEKEHERKLFNEKTIDTTAPKVQINRV